MCPINSKWVILNLINRLIKTSIEGRKRTIKTIRIVFLLLCSLDVVEKVPALWAGEGVCHLLELWVGQDDLLLVARLQWQAQVKVDLVIEESFASLDIGRRRAEGSIFPEMWVCKCERMLGVREEVVCRYAPGSKNGTLGKPFYYGKLTVYPFQFDRFTCSMSLSQIVYWVTPRTHAISSRISQFSSWKILLSSAAWLAESRMLSCCCTRPDTFCSSSSPGPKECIVNIRPKSMGMPTPCFRFDVMWRNEVEGRM